MEQSTKILAVKPKNKLDINSIVFIDTEVSPETGKILDYGAVTIENQQLHTKDFGKFTRFIEDYHYICGHNILEHDLRYIGNQRPELLKYLLNTEESIFHDFLSRVSWKQYVVWPIDTLYLSPLLFPCRPYHALVKDDKLQTDELNNPLNDAIKAKDLFFDEYNAYIALPEQLQMIFYLLLHKKPEFKGFFCIHIKHGRKIQKNKSVYFFENVSVNMQHLVL